MAAKKSDAKTTGGISKSDFIRSVPESMPARDVVAKAKAAGITLTENHVHAVRATDRAKKKQKKGTAVPAAAATGTKKVGRPPTRPQAGARANGASASPERAFVESALVLGIDRAEELLKRLRAKIDSIVAG